MYTLYHGDCLDKMHAIADQSVDCVICDVPYGTTACVWDTPIAFEPMWAHLRRIVKPRGAIVLFGSEPFSSRLRLSNEKWYKYDWVWRKTRPTSFVHAKNMPMRVIENVMLFSPASMGHVSLLGEARMPYNPQGLQRVNRILRQSAATRAPRTNGLRPSHKDVIHQEFTNYPVNILSFDSVTGATHPTEKPLPLLEYLIKTYTNAGDVVLDFAMGSGSTGHACANTGRAFIGCELYPLAGKPIDAKTNPDYFRIASERIAAAYAPLACMEAAS